MSTTASWECHTCTFKNAGADITNAPGRWCRANAVWLLRPRQEKLRQRSVWFWTLDECRVQWFTVEEARVRRVVRVLRNTDGLTLVYVGEQDCVSHFNNLVMIGDSITRYQVGACVRPCLTITP